jgi:hypothetical protein
MCVDCSLKGADELFADCKGGFYCKDKLACKGRLIHVGKPRASASDEEHKSMIVSKKALLRTVPLLTSATNGVEVDVGDIVIVLDRAVSDEITFLRVKTGKRIGYIREAYCMEA